MTRLDLIKSFYPGESWKSADAEGYMYQHFEGDTIKGVRWQDLGIKEKDIDIERVDDNSKGRYKWRPKKLRNDLENNGWCVINGPEDLPNAEGFYDFITAYTGIGGSPMCVSMHFDPAGVNQVETIARNHTHWRAQIWPIYGPDAPGIDA